MPDLFIDVETAGKSDRAAIISIGMQFCNIRTGEKGPTFYAQISPISALQYGEKDESTMAFWNSSKTTPEARREAFGGTKTAPQVGAEVISFVKTQPYIKPWGNGSIFDVTIMQHWFRMLGIEIPWNFWDARDLRTLLDIAGMNKKSVPFEGTEHVAIDDVMHEVELACAAYAKMFKPEGDDPELVIGAM